MPGEELAMSRPQPATDLTTAEGCFAYFKAHIYVRDDSPSYEPCADMTAFYDGSSDFHSHLDSGQRARLAELIATYGDELEKEYGGTNYIGPFGHCYISRHRLLAFAGLA